MFFLSFLLEKLLNHLLGIGLFEREFIEGVLFNVQGELEMVLESSHLLQFLHFDCRFNQVFLLSLLVVVFLAAHVDLQRVSLTQVFFRTEVLDVEGDFLPLEVERPELKVEPGALFRGVGVGAE